MFVAVVCFILFYFTQSKYLYYGRSSTRIYLFWWMLKTFERFCFVFVFILQSKLPSSKGMNEYLIYGVFCCHLVEAAAEVQSEYHHEFILSVSCVPLRDGSRGDVGPSVWGAALCHGEQTWVGEDDWQAPTERHLGLLVPGVRDGQNWARNRAGSAAKDQRKQSFHMWVLTVRLFF